MHEVICTGMILLIVLEVLVLIGLYCRESKVLSLVIYYTWITEEDDKVDEITKGSEDSYTSTLILTVVHLVVYCGLLVAAVLTDPQIPVPW